MNVTDNPDVNDVSMRSIDLSMTCKVLHTEGCLPSLSMKLLQMRTFTCLANAAATLFSKFEDNITKRLRELFRA